MSSRSIAWVNRGCPYVKRADRSQAAEWKFDTAEVARWRIDQAVGELGDVDAQELRRRKLAAETTIAEVEAARKRGEVADLGEVERQLTNAELEVRSRLLQIPARVMPMIAGLDNQTDIKQILAEEIEQSLTALADGFGGE